MRLSLLMTWLAVTAAAQTASAPNLDLSADDVRRARELIERGTKFLLSTQESDGGWASQTGPGVSALVLRALAHNPDIGPQHAAVRRGIEFILQFQRPDGGIYGAEGLLKNYESSVVVSLLAVIPGDAARTARTRAVEFLKAAQWDESEDRTPADAWYGGAGYGRSERPDLSNLNLMLDALHDHGTPPSDPAFQKALVFLSRSQMLAESNDRPFARGSTQGGFIYSPNGDGESKAGEITADGRRELRAYGSMTYAGVKSMIYAGLTRDDPRVRAALDWIRSHWTLDHNPNMPEAQSAEGLFYFYHTFARALAAYGEPIIVDKLGRDHDWRRELLQKLHSLQLADGSWINAKDRWMEGLPALTTAYSLLALQAAYPPE